MFVKLNDKVPFLGKDVFVAEGAYVVGDVRLKDYVSIWYGAVLRADISYIEIGPYSNVQDNSVIHLDHNKPTIIEDYVTIGHGVKLHACRIKRGALIGIGSIILDDVIIGEESIVAAGSVVPPGKVIPPRSLVMGIPGKVIRALNDEEIEHIYKNAEQYVKLAKEHMG